jgi:hypothetical protein
MRLLIIFVGSLGISSALACFMMTEDIDRDHGTLVDEATAIVLIEAVRSGQSCSLKVLRVLKGEAPETLDVECKLAGEWDRMTDFSNHTDDSFWEQREGRLGMNIDCTVFPPAFTPRKIYLALLGIEPDSKQYEEVGDNNDRWLAFVEERAEEK